MVLTRFFTTIDETSAIIVGTLPTDAKKFTFTDGTNTAVTYVKAGAEGTSIIDRAYPWLI